MWSKSKVVCEVWILFLLSHELDYLRTVVEIMLQYIWLNTVLFAQMCCCVLLSQLALTWAQYWDLETANRSLRMGWDWETRGVTTWMTAVNREYALIPEKTRFIKYYDFWLHLGDNFRLVIHHTVNCLMDFFIIDINISLLFS